MDVSNLKAGDNHYMAYVGPPTQYDFMGATQFRLLCTLGLRANHSLLDFGCGSLRTGKLFLSYLDKGRYFGIEPNEWLIEDAINNQIGKDLISLKQPQFDHNSDFKTDVFSQQFDFIVAQSIFSHTGSDLINITLGNFYQSLKPDGVVVATFMEGASDFDGGGWIYPGCVRYRQSAIERFAKKAGFFVRRLPWYHPRQTWYVLAKDKHRLPNWVALRHLSGAVLFDPEFAESWKQQQKLRRTLKNYVRRTLPQPIQNRLRQWLTSKARAQKDA
jgi:cyclopropane fatty-acyl-phospholipid synthase-like methyltransferase